jgi:hypothetical protein
MYLLCYLGFILTHLCRPGSTISTSMPNGLVHYFLCFLFGNVERSKEIEGWLVGGGQGGDGPRAEAAFKFKET